MLSRSLLLGLTTAKHSIFPLQALSIAAGLPYTVVMSIICLSLWRYLKAEKRKLKTDQGIICENKSFQHFSLQILDTYQKLSNLPKLGLCVVAPWYFIGRAYGRLNKYQLFQTVFTMVIIGFLFYCAILLMVLEMLQPNMFYIGLTVYIVFAAWCCRIRSQVRDVYHIDGKSNSIFTATLFNIYT